VATLKTRSTCCCHASPRPTSASSPSTRKRKLVDEVQTKANAIVHVLDDVRINLETLGEQKAVIDHVAEKVAQLEFMLQEARNTLRTLQHERELAERIEHGIKQLRSKTSKSGRP
jgi:hypothetical protein